MTLFLTTCAIGLLAIITLSRRPLKEWWLKRLVRQTVVMNRICELAGIAETDLKWLIRSEQRFVTKSGRKHRRLELEFGFNTTQVEKQPDSAAGYRRILGPSGTDFHEPYRVIAGQNGARIEESVASAILHAKARAPDVSTAYALDQARPFARSAGAHRHRVAR